MKFIIRPLIIVFVTIGCQNGPGEEKVTTKSNYQTVPKLAIQSNRITNDWKDVLKTRQPVDFIERLSNSIRPLSEKETEWHELIKERSLLWDAMKDSLSVPFADVSISDTTIVLLGYQGSDDAFTYQYQTVCFDLTSLANSYGPATDSINANRIDRIFAHEYTHLLHKEWARQTNFEIHSFKDSILWECLYEGIGMYRSMSSKWFPVDKELSPKSEETFKSLYPIFSQKMYRLFTADTLIQDEKSNLNRHLSRGSMTKKWGALPVGVWLAFEANGDDRNLIPIINKGPAAVIDLASKYLTGDSKAKFEEALKIQKR